MWWKLGGKKSKRRVNQAAFDPTYPHTLEKVQHVQNNINQLFLLLCWMYNRKLKKLTARVSTIPFELNRQLVLTAWHLTQATLLFKKKKENSDCTHTCYIRSYKIKCTAIPIKCTLLKNTIRVSPVWLLNLNIYRLHNLSKAHSMVVEKCMHSLKNAETSIVDCSGKTGQTFSLGAEMNLWTHHTLSQNILNTFKFVLQFSSRVVLKSSCTSWWMTPF